LSETTQVFCK